MSKKEIIKENNNENISTIESSLNEYINISGNRQIESNIDLGKAKLNKIIVYDKDKTPDYLNNDLFGWGRSVYFKINDKPLKFLVIDNHKKMTYTAEVRCKKEADGQYKCNISKTETHGNLIFKNVKEYIPIFKDISRQYSFECIDAYDKELTYTGTFNEITAKLDADGYIYNERKIKEVLKMAKDLLQKKGNYQTSKLPPYPGFFWIDNKLQTNIILKESISKDDLKNALQILESLISYFDENKFKVGYILSWMIMSPFNFAMKQAGNGNLQGSIYLLGKPNSGKTTIGSLIIFLWVLINTDTIFTSGSIDTVARFGSAISNMTFPVLFDEGSIIFNDRHQDIADLFKSSIHELKVRTVLDTNRNTTNIPSLSSIIFTSNYSTPKKAELGRRMDTFEFSVDHPRTITEIDKFEAKFDPKNKNGPMKILKYIGQYVANAMINNPEYIKKPWLEMSSDLWKEMYDYVDMEVPDWITNYELPDGLEQAWASEEERLFTVFKQLVLRNATTGEIYNDDENYRPRTPRDKADEVVKGSIENWIQLISPKKGRNKDKNLVVIDAGIVEDMTKEYHLPYELKRIAEDLKGEYDGIHFNGRTHKVAYWELDKFLDMFGAM